MERLFTLAEANGELPWLRKKFIELTALRRRSNEVSEEIRETMIKAKGNGGFKEEEVNATEKMLSDLMGAIKKRLAEITDKGIVVRDADAGLVDFPSLLNNEKVHLCWKMGEENIGYWHEIDKGYSNRRPL